MLLPGLSSPTMKHHAVDIAFERALSREIAASELMRMRVVAVTLAILLIADQLIFLFARGHDRAVHAEAAAGVAAAAGDRPLPRL